MFVITAFLEEPEYYKVSGKESFMAEVGPKKHAAASVACVFCRAHVSKYWCWLASYWLQCKQLVWKIVGMLSHIFSVLLFQIRPKPTKLKQIITFWQTHTVIHFSLFVSKLNQIRRTSQLERAVSSFWFMFGTVSPKPHCPKSLYWPNQHLTKRAT